MWLCMCVCVVSYDAACAYVVCVMFDFVCVCLCMCGCMHVCVYVTRLFRENTPYIRSGHCFSPPSLLLTCSGNASNTSSVI